MAGKHTLRRNICGLSSMTYSMEFDEIDRFTITHEDGSTEYAVSKIDALMSEHGMFYKNLNKHGLWDTVLDALEDNCLLKEERMNVAQNSYETVYTVPVTGHQLIVPCADYDRQLGGYNELKSKKNRTQKVDKVKKGTMKKIKRNPQQFMFWEGKYYDTNLVYVHGNEKDSLKPVGTIAAPIQTLSGSAEIVEFCKNVYFQNAQHKKEYKCNIVHQQVAGKQQGHGPGGWAQRGADDYLQVNLTYPRYVTHIGTTGAYPLTTIFPTTKVVNHRQISRNRYFCENPEDNSNLLTNNGNGVRRSKFARYVNILREDEFSLAWVTSYEVHYRHTVTNKWTLLCVTSANTDAFSEHVLDLRPYFNAKDGLLTQYLRIRPLEHHHRSMMRVSVYGVDPQKKVEVSRPLFGSGAVTTSQNRVSSANNDDKDKEADDEQECDTRSSSFAEQSKGGSTSDRNHKAADCTTVPTITYTVLHGMTPRNRLYVRDSYFHSYKDDWNLKDSSKHPKFNKKVRYAAHMREEYDDFRYEDPYDSNFNSGY